MTSSHITTLALPHETVDLSTDDSELLEWVRERVPPARSTPGSARAFRVSTDEGLWTITENGESRASSSSRTTVAIRLLERLNQLACFTNPRLAVHSGLVADEAGRGIWIPASSGGGKTTLAAQLTLSGLRYSTDEVASVQDDGRLMGWTKWLSVKEGSQPVLRTLAPATDDSFRHDGRWMVPPTMAGSTTAQPIVARVVAFPRYRPGAPTRVEPISRAAAVAEIAPQVFNLRMHGTTGVDLLVAVVRHADSCVRITYEDGWDAARTLSALLVSSTAPAC